jgi:hypothetical protein
MPHTALTTAEHPIAPAPGKTGPVYVLRDRLGRCLGTILVPCVELVFGRNAPTFLLKRRRASTNDTSEDGQTED